jgi:hypothetical protein
MATTKFAVGDYFAKFISENCEDLRSGDRERREAYITSWMWWRSQMDVAAMHTGAILGRR